MGYKLGINFNSKPKKEEHIMPPVNIIDTLAKPNYKIVSNIFIEYSWDISDKSIFLKELNLRFRT